MSDAEKGSSHIVDTILDHPQGEAIRETAREIADIVYEVRARKVFSEIFENSRVNRQVLRSLLSKFREQADKLLNESITKSDDDLYAEIILPLITRQIDRSA